MKSFFILLLALCVSTVVFAENAAAPEAPKKNWEFASVCFYPDFPEPANRVDVYGFKFGIPVSFGKNAFVSGVEASFGASMTHEFYGLQTAPLFTSTEAGNGVQFSIVNVAKDICGLQLGIVNYATDSATQIGLLNFIENSPLPFMIVFNCCY